MRRSFLKQALVVLATCALFIPIAIDYGVPAQAATFTFTDTNCDSFTLVGNTLSCVISGPPTCTVTGSSSAQLGANNILTASCSPAATSWVWTQDGGGTGCSSSASSACTDSQANAITVNYRVTGSNANGAGPPSSLFPVVWSNTLVAPSGCSVGYSPSSNVAAGTSVTMTANCTTGTGPFTYAWTGGPVANQTTNPASGSFQAASNGNVTVTNGAGAKQTGWSVTVGGGGGGGGGPISCSNVSGTTTTIDIGWTSNSLANTENVGPMGPNDAVIVRFTTSAVTSATGSGQINGYEFDGPPTPRTGALSTTPCDFDSGLPLKGGGFARFVGEIAPSVSFTLDALKSGNATLQNNTTYYFSIKNTSGCSTGSCNMQIHLKKPSGS